MKRLLLTSVAMVLPLLAMAQQVPAIQTSATAQTIVAGQAAPATPASTPQLQGTTTATMPPGEPPPVHRLAPSAPLNAKEQASVALAKRWRERTDRPSPGADGVVRWTYGSSQPVVVCAPLQLCDIALAPGEVVNSINAGDKARWDIRPAVSGSGPDRVTHIVVKPSDANLSSSIMVYTTSRTYGIKLIANARQYTPFTAFTYPEDAQAAWQRYGAAMGATSDPSAPQSPVQVLKQQQQNQTTPAVQKVVYQTPAPAVATDYTISGSASWKPERAFIQDGRTYIVFDRKMQYDTAPAVLGIVSDGWFSSAEQMLRYRWIGATVVIDGVVDHIALVSGVGSSQSRVDLRRVK